MDAARRVQQVVREHHGWVLARLVRRAGDLDLAEDALQLALEAALIQWPRAGVPQNPRAWLLRVARNKAIDEIRRRTLHREKEDELSPLLDDAAPADDEIPIRDDMLRLLFACCHPALSMDARVALTLRAVGGLSTDEIARAFLVPEATMAQRLVRAKRKIAAARLPFVIPAADDIADRIDGVLAVLYLIFNEGYLATSGDRVVREDISASAIRLARAMTELLPEDGEAMGLLALMVLHDARRAARTNEEGELVLLADQDRSVWNQEQIALGVQLTRDALRSVRVGPYGLQAAIAALHAEAPAADDTDWAQIAALYDELFRRLPTAVVALNRAVAIAEAFGPNRGLEAMEPLRDELDDYYLYHSARAELLRRCGEIDASRAAYERAKSCTINEAERRFIAGRIAALSNK